MIAGSKPYPPMKDSGVTWLGELSVYPARHSHAGGHPGTRTDQRDAYPRHSRASGNPGMRTDQRDAYQRHSRESGNPQSAQ